MSYRRHAYLVDPARNDRRGWGWTLLGLTLVVVLTYAGSLFYYSALQEALGLSVSALFGGKTAVAVIALLFSFVFWLLAVATVLPLVHKRDFLPLFGTKVLQDFGNVLLALLVLYLALIFLPPWDQFSDVVPAQPFNTWLAVLPLAVLGILVQVTAEEVLFRGYLQQQLAARFQSPLVWMMLPSLLFGLAHFDPSLEGNTWLFVIWAVFFGMMTADVTARSGSLGPAIALHLINNLFAIALISPPDSLSGLALFHYDFPLTDEDAVRTLLPIDFAMMFVSWLATRLAIRA